MTKLSKLIAAATPGGWYAKPSAANHRHWVIWSEKDLGAAIVQTANWLDSDDPLEEAANAELICYLANKAPAIDALVEAVKSWDAHRIEDGWLEREAVKVRKALAAFQENNDGS